MAKSNAPLPKKRKRNPTALAKKAKTSPVEVVYHNVAEILNAARSVSYRAVNQAMVQAYWHIGRVIVEDEQKGSRRAGYGETMVEELAQRLTKDFGKGFDARNLWFMRKFYLTFPILNAVRSELTWTHYRLLLRVEKDAARGFYLNESINSNWSTRELERQVNTLLYERLALSKSKKKTRQLASKGHLVKTAQDLIKDPYVLEFLDIKEYHSLTEKDLERTLIDRLQQFLLELGKGFAFIARQKRITLNNDHFYVDLVFYNYLLKCFVLVELKIGKLTHQDIGQMDFYIRYFEQEEKGPNDNPTIGLILCSDKNEAMVKYTLLNNNKRLFASRYKLYLPTEAELEREIEDERAKIETEQKLLNTRQSAKRAR